MPLGTWMDLTNFFASPRWMRKAPSTTTPTPMIASSTGPPGSLSTSALPFWLLCVELLEPPIAKRSAVSAIAR